MFDATSFDFRSLYVMFGIVFGWLVGLLLLALQELFDFLHNKNKEKK